MEFPLTMSEPLVPTLAIVMVMVLAVVWDVRERRIPNAVTYFGIVAGLGLGLASSGVPGLVAALLGLTVSLAIFALPVLKFGIGVGDLKLAMALGAIGGPAFALWMCLYAMAAGGLVAAVALVRNRGRTGIELPGAGAIPASRLAIPYAVPIAIGAVLAMIDPGLRR